MQWVYSNNSHGMTLEEEEAPVEMSISNDSEYYTYQSDQMLGDSERIPFMGRLGTYNGGGYVVPLIGTVVLYITL